MLANFMTLMEASRKHREDMEKEIQDLREIFQRQFSSVWKAPKEVPDHPCRPQPKAASIPFLNNDICDVEETECAAQGIPSAKQSCEPFPYVEPKAGQQNEDLHDEILDSAAKATLQEEAFGDDEQEAQQTAKSSDTVASVEYQEGNENDCESGALGYELVEWVNQQCKNPQIVDPPTLAWISARVVNLQSAVATHMMQEMA